MSFKNLYIIDIRFKLKDFYNIKQNIQKKGDREILSLTPYSSFILNSIEERYITYHDIISKKKFYKRVFNEYKIIEEAFLKNRDFMFIFRELAKLKTFEIYLEYLFKFLELKKKTPIKSYI